MSVMTMPGLGEATVKRLRNVREHFRDGVGGCGLSSWYRLCSVSRGTGRGDRKSAATREKFVKLLAVYPKQTEPHRLFPAVVGKIRSVHLLACFMAATLVQLIGAPSAAMAGPVPYDIAVVRAPRHGDTNPTTWQEVAFPQAIEPGQSLELIHPDGSEELLVDCDGKACSVVDPSLSFDGKRIYYTFYPDVSQAGINYQRGMPYAGADIYVIDIATRQSYRLTHQEWTPNTGVTNWAPDPLGQTGSGARLGYGILNLGPSPIPGPNGSEWVVFASNRNSFVPARGLTTNLQLFLMDSTGNNVRQIGHMNLGSALHPSVLLDGRIMFSSSEAQGVRDSRVWGLWATYPDGRHFEPLMSAFTSATALHFQTQLSNSHVAVTEYYNLNNNGFGTILAFPTELPATGPHFGSPNPSDPSNPDVRVGIWFFQPGHPAHLQPRYQRYSFSPVGLHNLTAFSTGEDESSRRTTSGGFAGKATHPAAAPNNDLLFSYTPGPANDLDRPVQVPRVQGEVALLSHGVAVDDPAQLVILKANAQYNYQQPRPVVSYSQIYGVAQPAYIPYLPDSETPFGVVGTSSFYNRNSKPGQGVASYGGLDPFNTDQNGSSTNWESQGADAGIYANSEIHAVRILMMEPSTDISYGSDGYSHTRSGFTNVATERLRILGEFPLRKLDSNGNQLRDGDGNPDTSFLARIPADMPFTFQTIDKDGLVLNMSQTWHQVRPGERHSDCGGCHAHANTATNFNATAAAAPSYQPFDTIDALTLLTKDGSGNPATSTYTGAARKQRMNVEYRRDIQPILERSCVGCHSGATPAAQLDLSSSADANGLPHGYNCLANDQSAHCGYKPVIHNGTWRQTNLSRFMRAFQSRRSLLAWKVFGRRLDGWQNSDHPTESIPGNASTLPSGANVNDADLDYTGTIMPPPGSGYAPLTADEKMTIARWIDLGAPLEKSDPASGWFTDDLRPVLHISSPRPEAASAPDRITFAAYDAYSGLNATSLHVEADFALNGRAAGAELADLAAPSGTGVWTIPVTNTASGLASGSVLVTIKDNQGNISRDRVRFGLLPPNGDPHNPSPPSGGGPGGGTDPYLTVTTPQTGVVLRMRTSKSRISGSGKIAISVVGHGLPKRTKVTISVAAPAGLKIRGRTLTLKKDGKAASTSLTVKASGAGQFSVPIRFQYRRPDGSIGTITRAVTVIGVV